MDRPSAQRRVTTDAFTNSCSASSSSQEPRHELLRHALRRPPRRADRCPPECPLHDPRPGPSWDVREGIPLHDDTVELIFSEHFLEHIDYPRSVKHYVREAHRVLTQDGKIITGVPDAAFALSQYPGPLNPADEMVERWYAKRDCRRDINTQLDLVNLVFRDQDDDPKYTPHFWAYDYEKLVQLFTEAGFATVEPWTFDAKIAKPKRRWGVSTSSPRSSDDVDRQPPE